MKHLLNFFWLFPLLTNAQFGTHNPADLKYKEVKLKAETSASPLFQLPFSSVRVIDARDDSSKIGFIPSYRLFSGKKTAFKKLGLKGGVAASIQQFYKDYYKTSFDSSGYELLVVMKKFWFSRMAPGSNRIRNIQKNNNLTICVYVKWEFYLGKDSAYLPIKRLDTVWKAGDDMNVYSGDEADENDYIEIQPLLKANIEMLDYSPAIPAFATQPKKKFAEICSYNQKRFHLPILEQGVLKKGVYRSFAEFCNNNPSTNGFREKKIRYEFQSDRYIEDENGNDIGDYWGYSTGDVLRYSKLANCRLYRVGNTFEVFIPVVSYGNAGTASSPNPARYEIWMPYQLDMQTGELY